VIGGIIGGAIAGSQPKSEPAVKETVIIKEREVQRPAAPRPAAPRVDPSGNRPATYRSR
jgi:hypothetical protein